MQTFEPNLVHAYKYELRDNVPMDQALDDANWIVREMFGTAESPKLPEFISEEDDLQGLVNAEHLLEGQQLYNKNLCVTCHGVTGHGRGETAALLTPYPRDYRMGVFKFKSTSRNAKPTRDDLAWLIRHGIAGTTMKALPDLTDPEIEKIVDYVIYLSWRGETERALIDSAVFDLDPAEDRLIVPAHQNLTEGEEAEAFEEGWEYAVEYASDIGFAWAEAEDELVEVEIPEDLPVPESNEQFREMMEGDQADALLASVKRGEELFRGKIAACNKCHGDQGKGDGQTTDFDDWTKDWTSRVGLDPKNEDALIPLMARGALAPKNIRPRNFAEGLFRGGSKPEDLFRRIRVGIAGTPMPAVTFVPGEFEERDIWHLINFIRSLDKSAEEQTTPAGEDPQAPAPTATAGL